MRIEYLISHHLQHAPRDQTGEAPAPMPVHRPIATTTYVPGEKVKEIKSFQFMDDGKFVNVYLPLENLDLTSADSITADFQTRSICITIRGLEQLPLQFRIARLNNSISPDECVTKILKTKLLMKLKKARVKERASRDSPDDQSNSVNENAPYSPVGPSQAGTEDDVSAAALNDSDSREDQEAVEETPEVKEHYPHWYQLRE